MRHPAARGFRRITSYNVCYTKLLRAQAAGHHRVALEMAAEKPQVGMDVELGDDVALAMGAALVADRGDAILV